MEYITTYLFGNKRQAREVEWFRRALYLFLLYKTVIYLVHFKALFSSTGLIYRIDYRLHTLKDLAFLLSSLQSDVLSKVFVFVLGFCSLLGFFKKSTHLSNFILWWVVININNYLYPTLTAGDYLLNQLMFFNIFLSSSTVKAKAMNDLKTACHNAGLAALKIQICLVYFLAAWFKLTDQSWLHGTALQSVFQIEEYSNPLLAALPGYVCVVLTYFTLVYQLLFPALIWVRPFKIYLLGFGIMQHLVIAFAMGLFSFGLIMVICYILFLKYDGKGPVVKIVKMS